MYIGQKFVKFTAKHKLILIIANTKRTCSSKDHRTNFANELALVTNGVSLTVSGFLNF